MGTNTPEARVYSVNETAKILKLSLNSVYAAIKKGDLPYVKVGSKYLILKDKLDAMLSPGQVA